MTPPTVSRHLRRLLCAVLVPACFAAFGPIVRAEPTIAEKIFSEKCANCHGVNGQGAADGYEKPLGSKALTLAELVEFIDSSMPEDDPTKCVGEEAKILADYVHRKFFTPERKPAAARSELTRLTVVQYRNALADLFAHFAPTEAPSDADPERRRRERPPEPPPKPRPVIPPGPGLRGEFYQSKGMSKADQLVVERVDSRLEFDFQDGSPAKGIEADQFSIVWEGGLLAPDTGYYEFRVSTPNGARLYFNLDPQLGLRKLRDDSSAAGQKALIDEWVGSGQLRESTARVFLVGGRSYPIRFEFFKYQEKTSSVKLEWKTPHGVWSVLDRNYTTTVRPPRSYVCDTNFPADDSSLGYERGSSVSPEWHAAITSAAARAATEVVERLPMLARLTESGTDRRRQIDEFLVRFATVAFRRPLAKVERRVLLETARADESDFEVGVRRAVLTVLMSPHFLYTNLELPSIAPQPYATASRLALALWDSIPDAQLLDAAGSGNPWTAEQIAAQAQRMMSDPQAKAKMRQFFHEWLELDERDLTKDRNLFPQFDERIVADLRRSLELFVDQVVWSAESDYRQLLLADYLVLNDRLNQLYNPDGSSGSPVAADEEDAVGASQATGIEPSEFRNVAFDATQRSGVLTHPYLLSALAYHNNTSPIHRGVFLTRNVVGRALNPPPQAVAFKDDEFAPDLTMREKITQLTRDSACASCHSIINPLGFALESFDPIGRWRTGDKDKSVETKSQYVTEAGETLTVSGARDVAVFAVASPSAHRAFVTHVFRHLSKHDPERFGADTIDRFRLQFEDDNFNIQNLWINIAVFLASRSQETPPSPRKPLS